MQRWTQLAPMGQARMFACTATLAGCFYVCGGFSGDTRLCTAERLDPVSLAWEPIAEMSANRSGAATAVVGGKLYTCGGFDGQARLNLAERFDPLSGHWECL